MAGGDPRLGIVVGLQAEAVLADGLGGQVAAGGGDAPGAEQAVARLVAAGVTALLSFGLAGGLDPRLLPGAIVVPSRVTDGDGEVWEVDSALAARLGPSAGTMLAGTAIIGDADAKRIAHAATGAVAVDLESGAVARAAARHGLPFAVLRAICDPADRTLPPAATVALDAQGRIRPLKLLRSLARHPGQIPGLIALGRDAAHARTALLQRVRAVGPLV